MKRMKHYLAMGAVFALIAAGTYLLSVDYHSVDTAIKGLFCSIVCYSSAALLIAYFCRNKIIADDNA